MFTKFWCDESGFIITAELVLLGTILILGLIVGLSSIQHAIVGELNDVGDSVGSLNQSYWYSGFSKEKYYNHGLAAYTRGSAFRDANDDCDYDQCDIACDDPVHEGPKYNGSLNQNVRYRGDCDILYNNQRD